MAVCIAVDVTKVAFKHNGLTFGETNEHSRDIIQDKLKEIGDEISTPFFNDSRILQCWLQIHIPALIRHPPIPVTRFSSYYVHNSQLDRKATEALVVLDFIANIGRRGDQRQTSPEKLTPRRSLTLPAGTTWSIESELVRQFLETGQVSGKNEDDIVAQVTMNGLKNEFFFTELEQVVASIDGAMRREVAPDSNRAQALLICELLLHRYPFEEIPIGGKSAS